MNTRKQLLEKLKTDLNEQTYEVVLRIIDMEDKTESELDRLIKRAEMVCLSRNEFCATDYLNGRDLVRFMELDNAERLKFDTPLEWDLKLIEYEKGKIK